MKRFPVTTFPSLPPSFLGILSLYNFLSLSFCSPVATFAISVYTGDAYSFLITYEFV